MNAWQDRPEPWRNRGWRAIARVALIGAVALASGLALEAQAWHLEWSDEFNGPVHTAPDAAAWGYDTGGGGFGNGEIEVYCAPGSSVAPCEAKRPNLYMDGDGHLVIHAVKRDGVWTSGRMKTEGKKSFQYGRIEARMKLDVADGFWPAFWMLGEDIGSVGWPKAGEQDILEWVQKYGPGKTSSTVHGPGYSGGRGIGSTFVFPDGGRVDDAFHTYGVVWSENKLAFYRDNPAQPYLTVTPSDLPAGAVWVYNQPFFLLLNFAIGGPTSGFSGATDATTPPSGTVLVDHVRVWRSGLIEPRSWYSLQSKGTGLCLTAIRPSACLPGDPRQEWQFMPTQEGLFRVTNRGTNVGLGGGSGEEWRAVRQGDGTFTFTARRGEVCLETAGAGVEAGRSACKGGAGQSFVLTQQP